MKYIITLLCLLPLFLSAQETRTETLTFDKPGSGEVVLDLKFAGNIVVKASPSNKVVLNKIITSRNQDDDVLVEDISEGSTLRYAMTYKEQSMRNKDYNCWSCDQPGCYCFRINYEVLLPKGTNLNLETISGDIEIEQIDGPVRAKTISGFVDISMPARISANVRAKTVTGEMYTDFEQLSLTENSNAFNKKMNSTIGSGSTKVELESVSGDIFIRKM
jgi:hypothetical protein